MEISKYKASSLACATTASLIILLSTFHIKGLWVFGDLSVILWLFWLGVSIGLYLKMPRWARVAAMTLGIGLVIAISFVHVPILRINWLFAGYLMIGLSFDGNDNEREVKIANSMALCLISAFIYAVLTFIEQRTFIASYKFPDELTTLIHDWAHAVQPLSALPLLYFFLKFIQSERISSLMTEKVMKWESTAICSAAFVICLIRLLSNFHWYSCLPYWLMKLVLCPGTIGIFVLIIYKLKTRRKVD